jgi:hypothetical protein
VRRWTALAVTLVLWLLLPGSAASGRQHPYVLTAIANVGTVYWRYDCVHYRSPEWSLGIRFGGEATTRVTYRAGRLTLRRTLPARLIWFPFRRDRSQRLSFVQAIEPRTLRARVLATFARGDCQSYFPPRLSVQLYPR